MKLSEYLLDRIFSLIYMLVAALVLLALLWLIETPAVFILFAEVILFAAYSTALAKRFVLASLRWAQDCFWAFSFRKGFL